MALHEPRDETRHALADLRTCRQCRVVDHGDDPVLPGRASLADASRCRGDGGCGYSKRRALTLGMTSGLDPALLYRIICASSGTSRMFETKAPIMLSGDATSGPRLAIFEKDLQIILAEAASLACAIPLAHAVSRVVASALASEGGGITDSSVIQAYRRQNGQEFGEWP
jgi:hypothetical protein